MSTTIEEAKNHLRANKYSVLYRLTDDSEWKQYSGPSDLEYALRDMGSAARLTGTNNIRLVMDVPVTIEAAAHILDWAAELYGRKTRAERAAEVPPQS